MVVGMKKTLTSAVLLTIALISLIAAGGIFYVDHQRMNAEGVVKMPDGTAIELDDPPTKKDIREMAISETKLDFVVPKVGVNTTLKEMSTYKRGGKKVINPPGITRAYAVRDWGEPGDPESMSVIALHSVRRYPDIPGSRLIDISRGQARVGEGDRIDVNDESYRVVKVHKIKKNELATAPGLWDEKPGKLLVITCLQRTEGKSVNNIVIEAQHL